MKRASAKKSTMMKNTGMRLTKTILDIRQLCANIFRLMEVAHTSIIALSLTPRQNLESCLIIMYNNIDYLV